MSRSNYTCMLLNLCSDFPTDIALGYYLEKHLFNVIAIDIAIEFKIRKLFARFEYLQQPLFSINLVNGTWKSHHSLNLFGKKVIILKNLSIKKIYIKLLSLGEKRWND